VRLALKTLAVYLLLVGVPLAALAAILHFGGGLRAPDGVLEAGRAAGPRRAGLHLGPLLVQIAAGGGRGFGEGRGG